MLKYLREWGQESHFQRPGKPTRNSSAQHGNVGGYQKLCQNHSQLQESLRNLSPAVSVYTRKASGSQSLPEKPLWVSCQPNNLLQPPSSIIASTSPSAEKKAGVTSLANSTSGPCRNRDCKGCSAHPPFSRTGVIAEEAGWMAPDSGSPTTFLSAVSAASTHSPFTHF